MSFTEKKRTYRFTDVEVCLDAALSSERDALMVDKGPAVAKRIKEIESQMRDSIVTLRISGVPYQKYLQVQRAHPARKGRVEAFDPETFYPDFVYKHGAEVEGETVTPLSESPRSQWDEFVSGFTTAEINAIASAVEETNGRRADTGFLSRGSAATEPSSPTSEPPETGE